MRTVLAIVALAALAVVGWVVGMGGSEELVGAEPMPVVAAVEPESSPPLAQSTVHANEVPPLGAVETSRESLDATPAPGDLEPAVPNDVDRVSGRIVLSDSTGGALPADSGVLTWIAWKGTSGRHVEVPVKGGEWSVTLEVLGEPEGLGVHSLEMGGERFVVDVPEKKIPVPEDRFIEVFAHQPSGSTLRVVDAETGAELSGVRLARGNWDSEEHPGLRAESRTLAEGLASPIDLTLELDQEVRKDMRTGELFVRADGYAWAPAKVDFDVGGRYQVALQLGAELVVTFVGYDPQDRGELRVRAPGHGRPLVSAPLRKTDPQRITGLPAGELRVGVEVGPWYDEPLTLGEGVVTLAPGEVGDLVIEVELAPEPEYATASGLLFVPEAWGEVNTRVAMDFLGTALAGFDDHQGAAAVSQRSADRPGVRAYAWSFDKMLVGSYELSLREPPFAITIDVPAGGRTDYEFALPPPAELLVRIVDDRTGEDIRTDALNWNPKRPKGVSGGMLESAKYDEELVRYRIRGPEMEIELMLWDWGYSPVSATVDLAAGVREHTLRLRRASIIEITLVNDETPVAFPDEWSDDPQPVDGTEGRVTLTQRGDKRWRFQMSDPGRYRFELPEVPGYQPVEPLMIDLLEGETSEQVVELRRL